MIMALYYDSIAYIYTFIYKNYFFSETLFFHLKPDQLLLKYHPEKSIHVGSYSKNTDIKKHKHFDFRRPLYCNPS